MSVVEWRDVVGFEELFSVSSDGRVFSKRSSKELKLHKNKRGYINVATRVGGKYGIAYCFKVHRLVAEAFLEQPSAELVEECAANKVGKVIVRHLDGNKENNHYSNLAWGTYKDNMDDWLNSEGYDEAISKRSGVLNAASVLTEELVHFIRQNYKPRCRNWGTRAIAEKLGIHHSTVSRVLTGARYGSVKTV